LPQSCFSLSLPQVLPVLLLASFFLSFWSQLRCYLLGVTFSVSVILNILGGGWRWLEDIWKKMHTHMKVFISFNFGVIADSLKSLPELSMHLYPRSVFKRARIPCCTLPR
jgi:hypothetical protein